LRTLTQQVGRVVVIIWPICCGGWHSGSRLLSSGAGGPLPSIDVADALLDELRELTQPATAHRWNFHIPD
jgi:hypothetical protein